MTTSFQTQPMAQPPKPTILLTGATGYVGGRLLPRLLDAGYNVRCIVRHKELFRAPPSDQLEVVEADILHTENLHTLFDGCDTAIYLIHSLAATKKFKELDKHMAVRFSKACNQCSVSHIIYLGGLSEISDHLSDHLSSRIEVGNELRKTHVPVTTFRASIIIGSGSLSFELIRNLTENLPLMLAPKWVRNLAQPIFINDVLRYLMASIELPQPKTTIYEIGGPNQVSYYDLIMAYAKEKKLCRWVIPIPFLTPYLSSLWLGFITPLYARVGRKLIQSITCSSIINNNQNTMQSFNIQPIGIQKAIQYAMTNEDQQFAETWWSDALSVVRPTAKNYYIKKYGNRYVEFITILVRAPIHIAFQPIQRIGGKRGWYYATLLWKLRGWIDLLFGGVGHRVGRRDPIDLNVGDRIDWWRVQRYVPNERILLMAEMRVPGRAWLEFEAKETPEGTLLYQTAMFDPKGLLGKLYWWTLYPIHKIMFKGLIKAIKRQGESLHET
jgi:uncharacterized protein YbjT (DUF2867 family)